ncbi:MAG: hypothetical protein B7O98_04015 [Zestosphaera tikiterensis]|uniref:Fibronectin type-III domain-containing protein n=1 Tax=Zestosphaera tikiterensis TaxID=1973259 RepID=A0A2R7Y9R0_9CREN|nr:MAG: hypothetical protein B7O98_04015 [Zestosphaera tikiterensis]
MVESAVSASMFLILVMLSLSSGLALLSERLEVNVSVETGFTELSFVSADCHYCSCRASCQANVVNGGDEVQVSLNNVYFSFKAFVYMKLRNTGTIPVKVFGIYLNDLLIEPYKLYKIDLNNDGFKDVEVVLIDGMPFKCDYMGLDDEVSDEGSLNELNTTYVNESLNVTTAKEDLKKDRGPTPPTVTDVEVNGCYVTLRWTEVEGSDLYHVTWEYDSVVVWGSPKGTPPPTSVTVGPLPTGYYCFRVSAQNLGRDGWRTKWSSPTCVFVSCFPQPKVIQLEPGESKTYYLIVHALNRGDYEFVVKPAYVRWNEYRG